MLTVLLSSSPNFYILDEPTNHLDMETIEALAKALNKFKVGSCLPVDLYPPTCHASHLSDGTRSRAESSWCHTTSA